MESKNKIDEKFMHRAIQLAAYGEGYVSPNPMVGAVIVHQGRIIGEGWHKKFGDPHAEVNAINSVSDKDRILLPESTLYVTLEPCSHYGKTPPCADLIVKTGIPKVVVGSSDPNPKVNGKGIAKLKTAGIEVIEGMLKEECDFLNRKFIVSNKLKRPFITLKWAQTKDGFTGKLKGEEKQPIAISHPISQLWAHRERATHDAVMVGTNTIISDNPSLDVRFWIGRNPRKITFDIHHRIPEDSKIAFDKDSIILQVEKKLKETIKDLYADYNITSLLVEGGATLLNSFIAAGLWDEMRIETSDTNILNGVEAPVLPKAHLLKTEECLGHRIDLFINPIR